MGRKSAISMVASMMIPVNPKGDQPPYIRSKHTLARSAKLIKFRTCIADEMTGESFEDRAAVRDAFSAAAKKCK